MRKKTRKWIAAAATLVVIGCVMLNVLAYNHARSMMQVGSREHIHAGSIRWSAWWMTFDSLMN